MRNNIVFKISFLVVFCSSLFLTFNLTKSKKSNIELFNFYNQLDEKFRDYNETETERIKLINTSLKRKVNVLSSSGTICDFNEIVHEDCVYLFYDMYYCGACKDSLSSIINSFVNNDTKLVILTSISNERVFYSKIYDICVDSNVVFYNLISKDARCILDIGSPILFQMSNDCRVVNPYVFNRNNLVSLRLYLKNYFGDSSANYQRNIVL